MRILLLSMPDTAKVLDAYRLPNLGVVSLAGQLTGHDVKVLDLVTHKPRIRRPIAEAVRAVRPQLVGLSAMTFQFDTLVRVARFIRSLDPAIRLVAGGYHATLMARELCEDPSLPLDFLVRGEGEATMVELADALERNASFDGIAGLSYKGPDGWHHNADRPLLDLSTIRLPTRDSRLATTFNYLGRSGDVIETSRGCPYDCKFCSISHMYGRTIRVFSEERIVQDLTDLRKRGTRTVFIVDDNITCVPDHFRMVCRAIVRNGLNDMLFAVQVAAAGLAKHPDLVDEMDRANVRIVFVGFESMLRTHLKDMHKPTNPEVNRTVADLLHRHKMGVIAGIIVGYPDDTRESIKENLRLFWELRPDAIYAQYLTPYPKTRLRQEMLEAGLVDNPDEFSQYDGFSCNVRTKHMSRDDLFRTLKKHTLRFIMDPRHLGRNYFVRHHSWMLLHMVVRSGFSDFYNVMTGKRLVPRYDV
jgi:anaerobic magnesium-protoporphyrin IX monomethyl ester cyclase